MKNKEYFITFTDMLIEANVHQTIGEIFVRCSFTGFYSKKKMMSLKLLVNYALSMTICGASWSSKR